MIFKGRELSRREPTKTFITGKKMVKGKKVGMCEKVDKEEVQLVKGMSGD